MKKEELKNLASLSKIKLSDKELDKFSKDMSTILSSVKTLESFEKDTGLKIKGDKKNEIPFSELREDIGKSSMLQEEALYNAPQQENGYFKVSGSTFNEENS